MNIFKWPFQHPFQPVIMNITFWWAVLLVTFLIWWARGGGEWLLGPRPPHE